MPKPLTAEGRFTAVVIKSESNGLFEAGEKKTPGVRLALAVVGGPEEGNYIDWNGWLSDSAFDNTVKTLNETFGFSGNFGEIAEMPDIFAGQQCSITTENEEYQGKVRLKVKWLNPVGGGPAPTLKPDEAKGLAARLSSRATALLKSAGAKPATTPKPAATVPAGAAGSDDEIPY